MVHNQGYLILDYRTRLNRQKEHSHSEGKLVDLFCAFIGGFGCFQNSTTATPDTGLLFPRSRARVQRMID